MTIHFFKFVERKERVRIPCRRCLEFLAGSRNDDSLHAKCTRKPSTAILSNLLAHGNIAGKARGQLHTREFQNVADVRIVFSISFH